MGRATQGVRLIQLREGDSIAAVTKVNVEDEEEMLESMDEITSEIIDKNAIETPEASATESDIPENGTDIDS
jgi:DNA gyrase subunit A